ncbi:MAG: hypothetical protein Kow0013_13850 [Pararhodobacter sp.]
MKRRREFSAKATLISAALMAVATLFTTRAEAQYVGGGYLTDYWGCEEAGWPTGIEMFRARYNPSEVQGGTSDLVLDLAVGGTMVYSVRGPMRPGRRWIPTQGYAVWGGLYRSNPRPRLRIEERRDAATGDASIPANDQIRMSVRIRNFNGRSGCTVTAHMMLRDMRSTRGTY